MDRKDGQPRQVSSYLNYLPAYFQQEAGTRQPGFLGALLLAFEQVLTGLGDVNRPGLEEIQDGIRDPEDQEAWRLGGVHRYFDPGPRQSDRERAPEEFLDWLAGWVALSMRADLDELRRREFIARAVSLYRQRGTKSGLEELIRIYTRTSPTIDELNTPFRIGVHSKVGVDTLIGGGAPHFFRVILHLAVTDPEQMRPLIEVARAIIDMEKPAHTHYELKPETPTFRIGLRHDQPEVHATIGVDTLLGPS